MKKVLFIKNAMILTVTSLALRMIGMVFRVWLADSIGAQGIGLYQMIFSVYILASTFATSGISTAVTRIITGRLAEGDKVGARRTLYISSLITLLVALLTSLLIIAFTDHISKYLIGDLRAALSLKILCIGLPFMGVCSCIRGYFLARRSTLPPSVCQIIEQLVRMLIIVLLIKKFAHMGLAFTCGAVLMGDSVAEAVGCFILWLFYKLDYKKILAKTKSAIKKSALFSELMRIALPISAGRYLHTALRTTESLITPSCLSKYAGSKASALEQFGMIKGMALPLLLFPASLLSAVSTLLIPEITESIAEKKENRVGDTVEKVFIITSITSFLVGGIFFTAAQSLGEAVYGSAAVGHLIRAMSPLVPFMYIDLIADGILKGLDEQTFLFKINVADSVIRVVLVILLVPRFGMLGFLAVMVFSNLFTSLLAVMKILKTTKIIFNFKKYFFVPLLAISVSMAISDRICAAAKQYNILYVVLISLSISILYFVFMVLLGGIEPEKILVKKGLFKAKKSKTV